MNKKKNIILPIICIVLLLITSIVYIGKRKIDDAKKIERLELAEEYNSLLKDLRQEKNKLEKDLENLKAELVIKDKGSSLILLADTNSKIVNEVNKQLKEYGYTGVIAIDDYYIEHNDGNYLTIEEITNYMNDGYDLVLCVKNSSDVVELYNKYSKLGLDIKGYYFPSSDITEDQINKIKNLNIEFVITYLNTLDNEDIIPIMSIGSYETNAKTIYSSAIENSLISALSIGSLRENEQYIENNVKSMLKLMKDYETKGQTKVTDLQEAKIRYYEYQDELKNSIEEDKLNKITELEDKLREIEDKLASK